MKAFSLLAILVLACLQVSFFDHLRVFNVKPDLLLCGVVTAAMYLGPVYGVACGILAGLFIDLFSPASLGMRTVVYFLWSLALYRLSRKISVDDALYFAFLVFLVSLIDGIVVKIIFLYSGKVIPLGVFFKIIILGSLFTAMVSPLFFRAARFLNRT